MFKTKTIFFLFIFSLMLCATQPLCFASATNSIKILEEINLPENLNFTVNDSCSEHAYFMQASANAQGQFIVYSRHVNPKKPSDVDFEKVYIDIYDSDGSFFQEISFVTPLDLAVELKADTINIYFYNYVLIYELKTQKLQNFSISDGEVVNGGTYQQLRNKKFIAGKWEYTCKKGFNGYVKLSRTDGEQEQLLINMQGTAKSSLSIILPGTIIGLGSFALLSLYRKRVNQHRTGDGPKPLKKSD